MGLSRQEYLSELPFPSPGDLPDPGIEPRSPMLQADVYQLSYAGSPWQKPIHLYYKSQLWIELSQTNRESMDFLKKNWKMVKDWILTLPQNKEK